METTENPTLDWAVIQSVESTTTTWAEAKAAREAALEAAGCKGWSIAKFRWYWTKNTDNPERVSMAEYARRTGVSRQAVQQSVKDFLSQQTARTQQASARAAAREANSEDATRQGLTQPEPVAFVAVAALPDDAVDTIVHAVAALVESDPGVVDAGGVELLEAAAKALRVFVTKAKKAHLVAA